MWELDPEPMVLCHEAAIDMYTPQQKPAGEVMREWYDWTALQPHDTLAWLVRHYPTGCLDLVVPANGKVNVPLVLCRLESHNWEQGGPADSARLLQEYYGWGDTLIAVDSTRWFPFTSDTSWRFLSGQGKYRFYVQYLDAPDKLSPPYPDFEDTVIVFDTTAATGSIRINNGARFARSASCSLGIAVADPGAGLKSMRLGTRLSNFLRNSGCVATDGVWDFTGGGSGYDSTLSMARLTVGTSGASTLYQDVPHESLEQHWNDSLHLTADVLVSLPGAEAQSIGSVRFGYRFTHDSPAQESLAVIASIPFSGGIACHAGTSNLDTSFVVAQPVSDTFWQFAGGYVEASVSGSGTSGGTVRLDNVRLEPSGPYPKASWWRPCTTAALWNLGYPCGEKVLYAAIQDSAGVESHVPLLDSVILDFQNPDVRIGCPEACLYVNGVVSISGWAYDPLISGLDTLFEWRRLEYRHTDSTNWLPCDPDSVSYSPAYQSTTFPPDVPLSDWNTTGLEDGTYYLRLSARDSAGNTFEDVIWVVVENEGRGGEFCSGPPGGGSGLGEGSIYVGSSTGYLLHLSDDLDSLDCVTINDSGSQTYVTAMLETNDDSLLVIDARNRGIRKLSRTGQNRRRFVSNLTLPVALT
jgi:hypothetical protein